jgi:hypothetical protein
MTFKQQRTETQKNKHNINNSNCFKQEANPITTNESNIKMSRVNNTTTTTASIANTSSKKSMNARLVIAATLLAGVSIHNKQSNAFTSTSTTRTNSFNTRTSPGNAYAGNGNSVSTLFAKSTKTNTKNAAINNPLVIPPSPLISMDSLPPFDIDMLESSASQLNESPFFTSTSKSTSEPLAASGSSKTSTGGIRGLPDHEQNSEFELMLGRAMDTLRTDYPDLLHKPPTYSIYDPNIEIVDPSGVKLHSLKSYKTSFQLVHTVVRIFYCPKNSYITYKLAYDVARKNIRISWNAVLIPRFDLSIYMNMKPEDYEEKKRRNQLHVDGISVYELDRKSGLIVQHRVEHLLVNDAPVKAPQGIFSLIQDKATEGPEGVGARIGVPVWNMDYDLSLDLNVMEFSQSGFGFGTCAKREQSMLFSSSADQTMDSSDNDGNINDNDDIIPFDQKAFNKKNLSRRKFNLKPITEAEFTKIQEKTKELEQELEITKRQNKDAAQAAAAAEAVDLEKNKSSAAFQFGNFLNKISGMVTDTCFDNFDCERPEVCCDFGFKKQCCRSGGMVFNIKPKGLERIPVKVVADDDQWARKRGGPGGMDMGY